MTTTDYEYRLKHTHRNDPCPCNSGKKYKKCHLPEDEAAQHATLKQAAEQAEAESNSDDGTESTAASGVDSTFVPKKRDTMTHFKGQKSKGGRPVTLPRRTGKA